MKRKTTILLFLFSSFLCFSQDFEPSSFSVDYEKIHSAQSGAEIGRFAQEEADRADTILNAVYEEILNQYQYNPNFIEQLRIAQRDWIKYRDSHLHSIFPFENSNSDPRNYVGNGYGYDRNIALAEITWIRVKLLYKWIDGKKGPGSDGVFTESYFP